MTPTLFLLISWSAAAAAAGDWGAPARITHDDQTVVTYRAKVAGGHLAVDVQLAPGWHTFTLDNDKRAAAKLAGKKALSSDKPTQIQAEGVEITGPWLQPQPKDFSQPDLRIFSWGYEGTALFLAPVKSPAAAKLRIKAQACTQTVCKNIDITAEAPVDNSGAAPSAAGLIAAQ